MGPVERQALEVTAVIVGTLLAIAVLDILSWVVLHM